MNKMVFSIQQKNVQFGSLFIYNIEIFADKKKAQKLPAKQIDSSWIHSMFEELIHLIWILMHRDKCGHMKWHQSLYSCENGLDKFIISTATLNNILFISLVFK